MTGALLVFWKELLELVRAPRTLLFTFMLPAAAYPAVVGMLASLDARETARVNGLSSRICLTDPDGVFAGALADATPGFDAERCPEDARRRLQDQQLDLVVAVDGDASARIARNEPVQVRLEYDAA